MLLQTVSIFSLENYHLVNYHLANYTISCKLSSCKLYCILQCWAVNYGLITHEAEVDLKSFSLVRAHLNSHVCFCRLLGVLG